VALGGLIGLVEMVYRLSEPGASTVLSVLGIAFDAKSTPPWLVFAAVLGGGLAALRVTARRVGERWGAIQQDLQPRAA
jgi:branched-chain amino acid transport system permease protein